MDLTMLRRVHIAAFVLLGCAGSVRVPARSADLAATRPALEASPPHTQPGGGVRAGPSYFCQAFAEYERARGIDPARPDAYYNLGALFESGGVGTRTELRLAMAYFTRFVELAERDGRPAYRALLGRASSRLHSMLSGYHMVELQSGPPGVSPLPPLPTSCPEPVAQR